MSKKTIFILFLLYFIFLKIDIFAQITAKRLFLSGSFGVSSNEIKTASIQADYNSFSVNPNIGYVWKDNWALLLGGSINIGNSKQQGDAYYANNTFKSNAWGVNAQIRRYLPINEKLGFYIPLILSFNTSKTENTSEQFGFGGTTVNQSNIEDRKIDLLLRPSFYYFIHRKWSLEASFATLSTGYSYRSSFSSNYNTTTPPQNRQTREDTESNFSFYPTLSLTNFFIGINYFFN